jgi:small-conductance mechanosensitive channel
VKAPTVEQFKLILASDWFKSALAILLAFVVWRLAEAGITKFYARRFVSRFIPRVPTYASLTKKLTSALIFFALALELLNIWKVNVAPALWSAGAISVVIGIGAQAIVRDMLTGMFFLFEDTFDVGDGVEITTANGVLRGLVEVVGLRETRIVDTRGFVVSVPNGSIVYVANMTRLPTKMNMNVAVPLRANVVVLRERIAAIVDTAAHAAAFEVEGVIVRLVDVTADTASFSIDFQVSRKHAFAAEAALRESIVTKLQGDGLLPGGAATAAVPSTGASNAMPGVGASNVALGGPGLTGPG